MNSQRRQFDSEIARLAIPALGSLIAEPLYVLVDTAIVGRIGTTELAGLALASTVLLSAHALMIFLAYGTTGPVARLISSGRPAEAAARSVAALWLAGLLGVLSVLFLWLTGSTLLAWLGASGDVLEAAELYLNLSLAGFPFLLMALAANGCFHGRQNTRLPLALAAAGAIGNLVLELFLVNGLGYGLGASAVSTVVSQVAIGLFSAVLVTRWVRSNQVSLRPDLALMSQLLGTGRALIVRTIGLRGSFMASSAVATRMGVSTIAAHQIALGVWSTLTLALDAVAIAGQALTGKWLGVGDHKRARAATGRMIEIDVAVGVAMGLALMIFRHPLAQLFTNDEAVAGLASFAFVHVAAQQPLNGLVFALDGILIGAGDLNYLAKWVIMAAATFLAACWVILATGLGFGFLWLAIAGLMAMRAVPLFLRWRQDEWLTVGPS